MNKKIYDTQQPVAEITDLLTKLDDRPDKGGTLKREQVAARAERVQDIFTRYKDNYPQVEKLFNFLDKFDILQEEHFWVRVTKQVDKQYDRLLQVTPHMNIETVEKILAGMLRDGAVDYLKEQLSEAAEIDELTRLPRRRRFFLRALEEIDRLENATVALSVFDLDHFKKVNDEHGHDAGDDALREVAKRADAFCKEHGEVSCSVYRTGGEEFAIIVTFPGKNISTQEVRQFFHEFYAAVFRQELTVRDRPSGTYTYKQTCSMGVVILDKKVAPEDAMTAADFLSYQAKEARMSENLQEKILIDRHPKE